MDLRGTIYAALWAAVFTAVIVPTAGAAAGHDVRVDSFGDVKARHDADRTVMAFASRLMDAVDPDTVRNDLAAAVTQALEPVHLSVWSKP